MTNIRHTIQMLEKAKVPPELLRTCGRIAGAIEGLDCDTGSFLTISFFTVRLGGEVHTPTLVTALNLLSNSPCAPLDAHGYLDIGDVDPYILPDDEFSDLLRTGELVHPVDGEPIKEPLTRVHLFYSVRKEVDSCIGE
jgi:hypothetical protein